MTPLLRRTLALGCAFALLAAPARLLAQLPPDPDLMAGVRQVREGDFEGAVNTLDGVTRRLSDVRERSRDFAQACLYLGVALVALEQKDAAKARFKEALARVPGLRPSPDEFSPKVLAVFEAAQREAQPAPAGGGSKTGLIVLGLGAAAGGIALAAKGGAEPTPPPGTATIANARFGTPVIVCPNGSLNVPIDFTILAEASNETASALRVTSASTTAVIVASTIPSEIDVASSRASSATPGTVAAGGHATLQVTSSLLCSNGDRDAPRFNEWEGRVTFSTSAGVFALVTPDRMRVNIP